MKGIACAGHWVIDHIKFIDSWPRQSELCNITAQSISNGGAPFNILVDLANLEVDFPTYGIGCIGDDPISHHIHDLCQKKKINTEFLHILTGEATSYTDVMTMEDTGARTMFHYRGANRKFTRHHVPIDELKRRGVKLFFLGHLLLMDGLERPSKQYGIAAAHLLHNVKAKTEMDTIVDIATESSDRYEAIVKPCLPYIDHFVINELEAGKVTKLPVRSRTGKLSLNTLKKSANRLIDMGVRKNVIIHMPEGAYWLTHKRHGIWHPSLKLPHTFFKATCGAGDAFCTGVLVGLHEEWGIEKTMLFASATSAASIHSSSNSGGIQSIRKIQALAKRFPLRGKIKYDKPK